MKILRLWGALALAVFACAVQGGTPNTTVAGAVSYEMGEGWVTHAVDESNQNRWFVYKELAGRSYCVEAALGAATYFPLDPALTLYTDGTGGTVYLSNTDGIGDPTMIKGSRICYQSALAVNASTLRYMKVNVPVTPGSGDSGFVRIRITDTTLIIPEFYLQNNSSGTSIHSVTLTLVNTGTTDVNASLYIPGYGNLVNFTNFSQLKAPDQANNRGQGYAATVPPPAGQANWKWFGAAYITHNAPPGAFEVWVDTDQLSGTGQARFFGLTR
jgi:hypothetical protein